MIKHMPALIIVIPLLAAIITPIAGRINREMAWLTAAATTLVCFIFSLSLLQQVLAAGKVVYWLGGWAPPVGIEYVIDPANAFVMAIVTFMAFAGSIYAKKSIDMEVGKERTSFFYAVYILFITGLLGMVITADIFNMYVFLEITSIAGYTLIAIGKRREALVAGFQYLILGSIAATFFLLGVGYLYLMTGTLNMADLARLLPQLYQTKAVFTAFALIAIGFAMKLALFPLHVWLPDAYTFAPSTVSAVMAATATKVGAYAFIRVAYSVFGVNFFIHDTHLIMQLMLVFAVAAILAGSMMAVAQKDIKKMLAYSSVGQIGYIMLGVALMNVNGLMASFLHLLNHAVMKGGLFLVVGIMVYRSGLTTIEQFRGMGKKLPLTMAAFTMGALSMIGVPLTVGFVSKWYLAMASIQAGMWYLIPVILLSSLLTAIYFWRIIDNIYFKSPEGETANHGPAVKGQEAPALMLIPAFGVSALCIVFGIFAYGPVSIAEKAALMLIR